jgi:hypothetical protein
MLNSNWKRLTDGTGCDEHGLFDVSESVSAFRARDTDVQETLTLSRVAPYSDFNNKGCTSLLYPHTLEQRGIVGDVGELGTVLAMAFPS